MKLTLIHGRDAPDDVLLGWGFDGPIIEIEWFHVTYMTEFKIGVANDKIASELALKYGWNHIDDSQLELTFHESLLTADGKYYGDWCIDN